MGRQSVNTKKTNTKRKARKAAKPTYGLEVSYSEKKGRHTVVETWTAAGDRALAKAAAEAFDLAKGEDGLPKAPDRAEIEKALRPYVADDRPIKDEYARQRRWYGAWEKLRKALDEGADWAKAKIDACTSVAAWRTDGPRDGMMTA